MHFHFPDWALEVCCCELSYCSCPLWGWGYLQHWKLLQRTSPIQHHQDPSSDWEWGWVKWNNCLM